MELQDRMVKRRDGGFDVQATWQTIFNIIPAGAYTCDASGLITYFNPRAETIWGRAPKLGDASDRYCGSHKMYSFAGVPIPHDECWMALVLRHGREYNGRELLIERPDGSRINSRVHANPFRNKQGQITGAVNLILDTQADKNRPYNDAAMAMIEVAVSMLSLGA